PYLLLASRGRFTLMLPCSLSSAECSRQHGHRGRRSAGLDAIGIGTVLTVSQLDLVRSIKQAIEPHVASQALGSARRPGAVGLSCGSRGAMPDRGWGSTHKEVAVAPGAPPPFRFRWFRALAASQLLLDWSSIVLRNRGAIVDGVHARPPRCAKCRSWRKATVM